MLEITVCEDEQADRDRLCSMLGVILDKQNIEHRITCYGSGEELERRKEGFETSCRGILVNLRNVAKIRDMRWL